MTYETPPDETPEPEQTAAPADPDESPFEPFETEDFRYPELEPALRDLLGR